MPQHAGYFDNEFIVGEGAELIVEDPSDETRVASFRGLSLTQFETAITAARRAFDKGDWSGQSAHARADVLTRFATALSRRADELIDLTASEAGCPRYAPVMNSQVHGPLRHARDAIELYRTLPEFEDNPLPLKDRITATGQTVQSFRRYSPIGVVAGIAAYNFPFFTALWKVMPALLTGNTVILRPSPLTPLSAMIFAQAAQEAELPPGVLNIVLEAGYEGGQLLTTHPSIDMVGFTGSSNVGVQVMQQAAPTMKRVQLELGGKSAQIFLPDSVERAAAAAVSVCTAHAGQGCALGTRIFVPQDRKAEVLEQMAVLCGRIRIGSAHAEGTQMGPVISAAQRARCELFVRLAVESGARVVTGGKRPAHLEKGYYFEPTVLDVPDNNNPAAQEEIFGPVVCVIGYRDLDHAVAMANDSRYGLSGYVYGQDRAAALKVSLGIRSGTVHINTPIVSAYVSLGGQRMSGIGRERGVEGFRIYQQLSCLNLS